MGCSSCNVAIVEATFFMSQLHEFDVAIDLFWCCIKHSYHVAVEIFTILHCFDVF
jgi:hypothetical protein